MSESQGRKRVLIAGAGVTGLEALLALAKLAGDRVELTLLAPEPDFLYKPHLVQEPFGLEPAQRLELAPIAEELGATLVRGSLASVMPSEHEAEVDDGSRIEYDQLIVCVGGRFRAPFADAVSFPGPEPLEIDGLVAAAARDEPSRIAFVVPPGVSWPLPLYEIALMTERRVRELGEDVEVAIVTPESAPLIAFGTEASRELATLLAARGIEAVTGARVREVGGGRVSYSPGDRGLEAAVVVSLPEIDGPEIPGLPADEHGFLPIDEHARVNGADDVFAAGDGTNFPLKQGGLGTQQADAAAEQIAALAGAEIEPKPFHPVLRGMLLTGDESLSMKQDVTGGAGEGRVSPEWLWWPPHKIGGRFLAAWIEGEEAHDLEPPRRPLDVEVSLPAEWHRDPMGFDPLEPGS